MEFSFRELECFIAVAEELSFTRAAKRLNLAQPPLSRHVKMLEERLGAALLLREPRRIALTPAGDLFYEETKEVATRLERAAEMVRRYARGETLRLRLGFVSAVMNPEIVGMLRAFRKKYPSVQVTLTDSPPNEQLRAIANGQLDGGFVGLQPGDGFEGVKFIPWYQEPLVCLVPADHRLAKRKLVALADLDKESFVAVSKESAPAYSKCWLGLCAAAGFSPRVVFESPRAQAVAAMVGTGSGIAILPAALVGFVENAVVAVPLKGVKPITHVLAMGAGVVSSPLQEFVKLIKSTF